MVEGDAVAVGDAQALIRQIASERTATTTSKLRTIPAELYPFIEDRKQELEGKGAKLNVPSYHLWTKQEPPAKASVGKAQFLAAPTEHPITLTGDRAAIRDTKTEIENLVAKLQEAVEVEKYVAEQRRHKFIVGSTNTPAEFFAATQCAVILPSSTADQYITFIGTPQDIQRARAHAKELQSQFSSDSFNIDRQFKKDVPKADKRTTHVTNFTQYLRQRRILAELEQQHSITIDITIEDGETDSWDIYSDNNSRASEAKSEIIEICQAHPPSRMATIQVDPFYHQQLQKDILPRLRSQYGVHALVPEPAKHDVLLVFEGLEPDFQVSRGSPSQTDIEEFQKSLQAAQNHIREIYAAQAQITSTTIQVPVKLQDKLKKFFKAEQDILRAANKVTLRISTPGGGEDVLLRGPAPTVEELADKAKAWVKQAKEEEKERGYTVSFDFPQKHANLLIGKGGSHINELREKFDVDINIKKDSGMVELTGPKAKAAAAQAHIKSLEKKWSDEVTHTLLVDPKFHGDVIGSKGSQVIGLETRHKVQIRFPRAEKALPDGSSDSGRKTSRPQQAPNEIIIKGPTKGANEARSEILELVQYLKDNSEVAVVSVQQSQIPSIMGAKGKNMEELRRDTGATIEVPNAKDQDNPSARVEITIKGTKKEVADAKKLLEEKVKKYDQTVTKHLPVDKKHHRVLIGAGGSKLKELILEAGGPTERFEQSRSLQFPKSESDGNLVKIEGTKEFVDKISAAIEKIIAERDSQITDTIEVPIDQHRNFIGKGGDTKKAMEKELNVSLDIPRQDSGRTEFKIIGQPADVEKAKDHILKLIKVQHGETIQVPRSVHHRISDRGTFFRKLQRDGVTVSHDGQKAPPMPNGSARSKTNGDAPLITDDPEESAGAHSWHVEDAADTSLDGELPWVVRGKEENVQTAIAQIKQAIEEAQNNKIGYLSLADPKSHRFVIGQGGSKVNSIRKESGCEVTVPRSNENAQAIEISGSAEEIEHAKKLILEAVLEGSTKA